MKLFDFSTAREPESPAPALEIGTFAYMPPEQRDVDLGETIDPRVDVYSLGVVLYELLCTRRPFDLERGPGDVPRPPSTFRPGLPRELDRICLKALRWHPDDRHQSVAELRAAIAAARVRSLDGDPLTIEPSATRSAVAFVLSLLVWIAVAGHAFVQSTRAIWDQLLGPHVALEVARLAPPDGAEGEAPPETAASQDPGDPEVAALLRLADRSFRQRRFTTPEHMAASLYYARVLERAPHHPIARRRMSEMQETYLDWAERAWAEGRRGTALTYLRRGASLVAGDPEIGARLARRLRDLEEL